MDSVSHVPANASVNTKPISERMRTPEAATHVGLSESTLTKLRVFGGGPLFLKLGRRVLYDRSDLDAWLSARKRTSTSDEGGR